MSNSLGNCTSHWKSHFGFVVLHATGVVLSPCDGTVSKVTKVLGKQSSCCCFFTTLLFDFFDLHFLRMGKWSACSTITWALNRLDGVGIKTFCNESNKSAVLRICTLGVVGLDTAFFSSVFVAFSDQAFLCCRCTINCSRNCSILCCLLSISASDCTATSTFVFFGGGFVGLWHRARTISCLKPRSCSKFLICSSEPRAKSSCTRPIVWLSCGVMIGSHQSVLITGNCKQQFYKNN